jgi:hypothetical protein
VSGFEGVGDGVGALDDVDRILLRPGEEQARTRAFWEDARQAVGVDQHALAARRLCQTKIERVPHKWNRFCDQNALKTLNREPDSTIRRFRLIASGSNTNRRCE